MAEDGIDDGAADYGTIADQISAGILKNLPLDAIRDMLVGAAVQSKHGEHTSLMELGVETLVKLGELLVKIEEPALPLLAGFIAPIVSGLFGTPVDAAAFARRADRESRGAASGAIVEAFMRALSGGVDGEIEPSDEGAVRIASAAVHATLEGQVQALLTSMLSDMIPFDFGHFHELTELPEEIIRTLGVSRLVRRALAPLVDATAAVPMRRFANRKFRPNLLGESEIIRAFQAGDYSAAEAAGELAQLGYSDRRQDLLLKHATKFLSAADALALVRDGQFDRQFAIENLRAQGYDQTGAEQAVVVEEIKHLNSIRDDSAAAIRGAYVARRIDDAQVATYLSAIYANDEDQSAYLTAWRTVRDLSTKRLSVGDARAAVKAKVIPIAGYREALRLDGYDEESVLTLELLLEVELNAEADIEALRARKIADAAEAKQAAADAAAKRAADVEAARVLARRGSLALLQRAVITGLIPVARYVEVLTPQYDGDTVGTMVALVEQQRAEYVAQQQKADEARKRAVLRHVDVGALQAAYFGNVLTLDQVAAQLAGLEFAPGDVAILTATMRGEKADRDAAAQQRADAAAKAKTHGVNLATVEDLVRRGHRTIADYTALLAGLGYDAGAVAAMVDLLNLHIADDTAARDARAAAAAAKNVVGLTLEQIRRAVILGVATIDDYQAFLVDHKFAVDAQLVLVAELRADVEEADAARARRDAAAPKPAGDRLPLSAAARAAQLGIVSPDAYAQRLRGAGYTDDDIAIELDLLAVEIADTQAARAKVAPVVETATDRGLNLAALATAVKLGTATLDDYRARAVGLGLRPDAADALVAVLARELATVEDAETQYAAADAKLKKRDLSLGELDAAVIAGQMTIDAYGARLVALGFSPDDTDLLVMLLSLKLSAAPGGGA